MFLPNPGSEPNTIYNFNGFVAVATFGGTGKDQASSPLSLDCDIRAYAGQYVGTDAAVHRATFGFVWVDLYKGAVVPGNFDNQVHDFNPGIQPSGLFWTVPISRDSLRIVPEDRTVVLDLQSFSLNDFGSIPNSLMGKPGLASTVNIRIEWSGSGVIGQQLVRSSENKFMTSLMQTTVAARVSASTPSTGFSFTQDPGDVKTNFAVFGMERNGSYYRAPDGGGPPPF